METGNGDDRARVKNVVLLALRGPPAVTGAHPKDTGAQGECGSEVND